MQDRFFPQSHTHHFLKLGFIVFNCLCLYFMFYPLCSFWTKYCTNFLFPMHGIYYVTIIACSFISLYKYYVEKNESKIKPFITYLFRSSCHLLFLMSRIWAHSLHSTFYQISLVCDLLVRQTESQC
jgi:hypothetical protein